MKKFQRIVLIALALLMAFLGYKKVKVNKS